MRILIADKLGPVVCEKLEVLGAQVQQEPALIGEGLTRRLGEFDPEVLVVRSTRVTAADLSAASGLSLVVRAGAGVNTIDLKAASAAGIYVANCPGKNAAAVAELTIGHLINLDRRIADNVQALREHRWAKKKFSDARGLNGRVLAVLGCGTIGREVAARAQALGMRIVGWDVHRTETPSLAIEWAETPEDAVRDADAVTVHLAMNEHTRGRIGASVFSAMREGAYFINTARGEVIDQAALLQAIDERGVRAGLDVFDNEPAAGDETFEDSIADNPHVYGTHHIGASTQEAEEAVGREVVRIVGAYTHGQPIPNCVNLASSTNATHLVVVRHADRVGVLAAVLKTLGEAGHNVEEMQNIVFSGAESACARIAVVGNPSPETLRAVASEDAVYAVSATGLDASVP